MKKKILESIDFFGDQVNREQKIYSTFLSETHKQKN